MAKSKNRPSSFAPVTVVIVDPDQMRCKFMASAFRRSRYRFKVVACETDSRSALNALQQQQPKVATISAGLRDGPLTGLDLLRRKRAACPQTHVVLVLDVYDRDLIVEGFRQGADAVFSREEPFPDLCKCIEVVSKGEVWIRNRELRYVVEALGEKRGMPKHVVDSRGANLLSKRQEELVQLVADGLSNSEIAKRLQLSQHTVKNYLLRIFDKLGVSSRVELILYFFNQTGSQTEAYSDRDRGE